MVQMVLDFYELAATVEILFDVSLTCSALYQSNPLPHHLVHSVVYCSYLRLNGSSNLGTSLGGFSNQ
jgi:hypothetical protein